MYPHTCDKRRKWNLKQSSLIRHERTYYKEKKISFLKKSGLPITNERTEIFESKKSVFSKNLVSFQEASQCG